MPIASPSAERPYFTFFIGYSPDFKNSLIIKGVKQVNNDALPLFNFLVVFI